VVEVTERALREGKLTAGAHLGQHGDARLICAPRRNLTATSERNVAEHT
jgi:hypothetical protein